MDQERSSRAVQAMPTLALRGLVAFPGVTMHFDVKRSKSILAIKAAMDLNREIFIITQENIEAEDPEEQDLYQIGVVCTIKQLLKADDNTIRVLIEGKYRAKLVRILSATPFLLSDVRRMPRTSRKKHTEEETEGLMRFVKTLFQNYCGALPNVSQELVSRVLSKDDPEELFTAIVPNLLCAYEDKQALLEKTGAYAALEELAEVLDHECTLLEIEHGIYERVKERMDKNQRDYFLREQMRVIQDELGENESEQDDADEMAEKIRAIQNISEESREKLLKECERLSRLPIQSQEANVIQSYLEVCLDLPWDTFTQDTLDVKKARAQLDRDHYGLDKVKNRILELLSVRKLAPDVKGQIICLVGPPGVGKTSIAASVAKTLGRRYVRVSLGGVTDESEIRGHRKTYLGSMPGRIINAFRQAKTNNPLILLDEIDKLGNDYRGDPASAMLETLDPEQNVAFVDRYVEIPFDLSRALFITTANNAQNIPGPLYDRMEIIELPSYTREEKFQIAKRHLVKKQMEKNGLNGRMLSIRDDALYELVDGYTREAGVRTLERQIGFICRKAAKRIVEGDAKRVLVTKQNLSDLIGPAKFRRSDSESTDQVGVVNGLAWTSVGGEMLEIECAVMTGSGKLKLTGSLGDVMRESADIAVSYVRTIAEKYHIDPDFYKTKDLHIHAPEGAVPKDGPSAGVTMVTAVVSALSSIPVRGDVAMTGEISLRGRVMPIGGLREKSMAAYRENKKIVIIPKENEPDLYEVDPVVKESITFKPVERIEEVLELSLVQPLEAEESKMLDAWCEPKTPAVSGETVRI